MNGLSVSFDVGDSWVEATLTDQDMEPDVEPVDRPVVNGFVLDDLDIGKLHLDLVESKRKSNLYQQMAQVEDGWADAAAKAQAEVKQLSELIEAWEERHG